MSARWSAHCPGWVSCSEPVWERANGIHPCRAGRAAAVNKERLFRRHLLVALFAERERAEAAVGRLIESDYAADSVSLLGKGVASGDDILGVHDATAIERMKSWGRQGAVWGGLWGVLGGTAGAFAVPGLGVLFVIGPIVEGVAAAVAGAGTMALAALLSEVLVKLHRCGIPEEDLQALEQAIRDGCYVMILQGDEAELAAPKQWLPWSGAVSVRSFPPASG